MAPTKWSWGHTRVSAASFIDLFERSEPRMRQITDQLWKFAYDLRIKLIYLFAAVLVGSHVLLVVNAMLSKDLFILFLVACPISISIALNHMASESLNEVDRLREEFRMLVLSVTCGLEGVKITCGDLRRTSVGAETLTFIRLEITILELLASSEKLRTPASVLRPSQVAHDCRKTLDGFAKVKTELQSFEESQRRFNCQIS